MIDATCKTCPFFSPGETRAGSCQRNAPRPETLPEDRVVGGHWRAVWPVVQSDWFCGEHPQRQRDHLAAMMAQGILAGIWADPDASFAPEHHAADAYAMADALLAQSTAPAPGEEPKR